MSKEAATLTINSTIVVDSPPLAGLDEHDLWVVANYIGMSKDALKTSAENDAAFRDALNVLAEEAQKAVKRMLTPKPHPGQVKISKLIEVIRQGKQQAPLDEVQLAQKMEPHFSKEELVNLILSYRDAFQKQHSTANDFGLARQLGQFIEARMRQIKIDRETFAEGLQIDLELAEAILDGELPPSEIKDFMLENIAVVIGYHVNMLRIILKRPLVAPSPNGVAEP